MNKFQIYNIFYFLGIMKYNTKILNISPDYLIEKSLVFFNSLGNKSFIPNVHTEHIWIEYCKIWNIDKNNYEVLNIINFILMSNFTKKQKMMNNFKKYIGEFKNVSDCDLHYIVHPILLESLSNVISNSRYLKLLSLK